MLGVDESLGAVARHLDEIAGEIALESIAGEGTTVRIALARFI